MNTDHTRQATRIQARVAALPANPLQRVNMDAIVLSFLMIFLFATLMG